MATLTTQSVSPKATPLPPLPAEDPLTPAQWKTLLAIMDTIVPSIKTIAVANTQDEVPAMDNDYQKALGTLTTLSPDSENNTEVLAKKYLEEKASANPAFRESLYRLVGLYMPTSTKKDIAKVLNLLE